MKRLIHAIFGLLLAAGLGTPSSALAYTEAPCTGQFVDPISGLDWNLMYPITVAGARIGGGINPPLMDAVPPTCVCPTIFGFPMIGITVTYWEPLRLAEIEPRPGCMSSLGGVSMLSSYAMLHSEVTGDGGEDSSASRMQVHIYDYPVFSMLDMFASLACKNASHFDLAYMTEIDSTWQDDLWAAIYAPENALFSHPIAQVACAIDALAANIYTPLDPLFWCAGSWGPIYPLTGNSGHANNGFTQNNQILIKYLARSARLGLEWQSIGPSAICSPHPNPIVVKSQYRYNQVAPVPRRGLAVVTGAQGLLQFPPVANTPTQEHSVSFIWQGKQCCVKLVY